MDGGGPMMVDSGCSLYDDLEIQDMFILEDSKFIVIPVLTFTVRVSFLFRYLLSFNILN